MWLAVEVETLAAQYWRALQIGKPHILPDAEVAKVMEKFRSYGQVPEEQPAGCC
jgi:L-fuculose-phosphate aldolase